MTELGPLTDEQLAAMPAKTKKDPVTVALYQNNDFLKAYALHTDRRIEITGYKAAIGADENNWDKHGELQRDFLISQGLKSEHRLLEIGSGTGRLARKVVPYLDKARYQGLDISAGAISAASELASKEGWSDKLPRFHLGELPEITGPFDYVWAFSVFIHLPPAVIESLMRRVVAVMHAESRFYWSYVPEQGDYRSGVKQFRARLETYQECAVKAGLTFEAVPEWMQKAGHEPGRWSGWQRVALSRLA